jgi:hypothetical protein
MIEGWNEWSGDAQRGEMIGSGLAFIEQGCKCRFFSKSCFIILYLLITGKVVSGRHFSFRLGPRHVQRFRMISLSFFVSLFLNHPASLKAE